MAATSLEPSQDEARMDMAAAGGAGRVGFGLGDLAGRDMAAGQGEPQLSPEDITLVIEDGLLMALGPDGDPVPPNAFTSALASWPEAEVALQGGPRIPAERAGTVLVSQAEAGQRGEVVTTAWLRAMLGVGPQPEMVTAAELADEQLTCELTAIGDEILISPTAGEVFLITDAKGETAAEPGADAGDGEVGRLLIDGRVVSAAVVAGILRDHEAAQADEPAPTMVSESALADCVLTLRGDSPVLTTPIGAIALVGGQGQGDQPLVRLFQADGRPASRGALLVGLGFAQPVAAPAVERAVATGSLDGLIDLAEVEDRAAVSSTAPEAAATAEDQPGAPLVDPLDSIADMVTTPGVEEPTFETEAQVDVPVEAATPTESTIEDASAQPSTADEATLAPLPLVIQPPCPPGVETEAITVVMVRGLPEGARLSAGIDDGGGSWTLRHQDLEGLHLHLPTATARLAIEVAAIAVINADGALAAATEQVELAVPAAPVALPLEMAMLDDGQGPVDALVIRGVPDHARLSAGILDAAIGGWVLRPTELAGLTLLPAVGASGVVELTVRGVALGAGGGRAPSPIQLSVSLD